MLHVNKAQNRFPSDAKGLADILLFIEQVLRKEMNSPKLIHQIVLAVEEMASNVIKYAYIDGKIGAIEMSIQMLKEGELEIEMIDWGSPFDPTSFIVDDKPMTIEQAKIGKKGILLTRQVMDDIHYFRANEQNHLIMKKKL